MYIAVTLLKHENVTVLKHIMEFLLENGYD